MLEQPELSDKQTEHELLGLMLAHDVLYPQIAAAFTEDDFTCPMSHLVFHWAGKIMRSAGKLSVAAFMPYLEDSTPGEPGATGELRNMIQRLLSHGLGVYRPEDVVTDLIARLSDLAKRRVLRAQFKQAIDCINGQTETPCEQIASETVLAITGLLERRGFGKIRSDYDVLAEIIEGFKSDVGFCPTGIAALDKAMGGGLYPGRVYGFAGRKKFGKTLFAGTVSWKLSQAGHKHLFVCGEMGDREILERMISSQIGENPISFRTSRRKSPDFQEKVASLASKMQGNLQFSYMPAMTFDDLKRVAWAAVAVQKVKGIIVDYWQLVGGKEPRQSEREHLDNVAQWIAGFCKKYGVWGLVTAQANQDNNTRGGEGIRLAFDQVYRLERRMIEGQDYPMPEAWLEMMDTRYTPWQDVGNKSLPAFQVSRHGTHFEELL